MSYWSNYIILWETHRESKKEETINIETTTVRTTLKCVKILLRCCSLIDDLNVTNAVLLKCTHKHKHTHTIVCTFISDKMPIIISLIWFGPVCCANWQQQLHEQDKWTHQAQQNNKARPTLSLSACALLASRFRWLLATNHAPLSAIVCR